MHAAEALGQLGDPRPLPGLRRALRDPDPAVRGHVARALGRLGDLLGAAALMAALDDRSPFVRAEAAGALGVLECRSATPSLRDLLEDSSPLVRVSAATSLASLGESNALPVLAELCRDGDPTVRLAAIRAFRVLRAADSAAPLLAALHDPIGAVRGQAFEALVLLGEPAIPGLCRLLGDPTPAVQVLAARILHDMAAVNPVVGLRAALPRLRQGSRKLLEDSEYRAALRAALDAIERATEGRAALPLAGDVARLPVQALPIPGDG